MLASSAPMIRYRGLSSNGTENLHKVHLQVSSIPAAPGSRSDRLEIVAFGRGHGAQHSDIAAIAKAVPGTLDHDGADVVGIGKVTEQLGDQFDGHRITLLCPVECKQQDVFVCAIAKRCDQAPSQGVSI